MVQGDVLKISLLIYSPSVAAILKSSLNYFEMDARQPLKINKEEFIDNIERDNEVKSKLRKVYNNERV